MDHKPESRVEHAYVGTRDEADKLIAWLMNKRYWVGVCSAQDERFEVRCGCEPEDVRKARIKIAKAK